MDRLDFRGSEILPQKMNQYNAARYITIRGIVQGVGFRPFVYSLSKQYGLNGWVRNSSNGVEIEVVGLLDSLQNFETDLKTKYPPLARIDSFESVICTPDSYTSFNILDSINHTGEFLPVSPDVAICPDCRRELLDPTDRRYRYPFINCTNCGPRFTIVREIPYDRPNTTMASFPLCPDCKAEYEDPLNRRFHAQPVACPDCGPHVWFEQNGTILTEHEAAIETARDRLKEGQIIAIKGLGGYHLACDALNAQAVETLRERKKRSQKAFALMAFDMNVIRKYCEVNPEEEKILTSHQSPVVLLKKKTGISLPEALAPGQTTLGMMLPYTPLHLLLLEPEPGYPELLVMTSGNMSEEPIAYHDADSRKKLSPLADGFLQHNREIHTRMDDSVVRVVKNRIYPIRRSRGYAPDPLNLPWEVQPMLACGAELKNTFCVSRGNYAFLSHHIGDLENYETLQAFEEGIRHYEKIFRISPEKLVCDLHPDYLSTRYAESRAQTENLPLIKVQHHHSHLAACLADNGWKSSEPVIGLCLDGTGMGTDGAIWGGEIFFGGYQNYLRKFHFSYIPLPGGDLAIRKPARVALAGLWSAGIEWDSIFPSVQSISPAERKAILFQLEHQINTVSTSSLGRIFDAVSSLAGVCQTATYEGQAAVELETSIDRLDETAYDISYESGLIHTSDLFRQITMDIRSGITAPIISARFHNGLVQLFSRLCCDIRTDTSVNTVALSGGVWQNTYLLEKTIAVLTQNGFNVLVHHQVPTNDGGISLGQIAIAAHFSV